MTYKQSSKLLLSQYNSVGADRKSKNKKSKHGGCLIAVSNNVSFTEVDIRHLSEAIQVSLVVIKLNQPEGLITSIKRLDNLEDYPDLFTIQIEITGTSRESRKKQEVYYSYCNCYFDYQNELIANNPFDPYCYSSIDKNTNFWYEWIFHLIEKTTPRRTRRRQEFPPWVSSETSHKLNKLKTLRRRSERCVNFSPYLATQLIELEKHCADLQERDRQEYEKN